MSFNGFEKRDFETFQIDGLENRMEAIQKRIQPKFHEIGAELTEHLSATMGNEFFLHIARHARRSVNPPNDTWLAIAENKRGYKKHPHFQVGLFDDHIFIWLAFIYELPSKENIAKQFLDQLTDLKQLPNDFVYSLDHMKKDASPITDLSEEDLERFRDVKKAEFLVGRHIGVSKATNLSGEAFIERAKDTFDTLAPFYRAGLSAI
ncbi:UPF0637 protein [Paraliobacillus quinghaiensis]|uniref:UPF0637 protein GCM10011351_02710 n=1 Tax=Paraliobacillus quinghaiensis TaxID=470815 RepID=A0A917TE88_9BACI|nr:DUF1054 domain-containing protein [Paraliobacillus quinghaiensis]GGM20334.1 UPF0637 protein [Paraliobacillus quinghaiensis]